MDNSHRVYVGTIGEGVWRSLDGGVTFSRAADGMFVECHVRALAVHPQNPRVLFLGSEQGLFRSDDGADNWQSVHADLAGKQIWSILVHPADPNLLVVGTCPAAIFRSADGGRTWSQGRTTMTPECPRIIYNRVTTLKAEPDSSRVLWAGVEIDGLHRSADAGLTWEPVGQGLSSRDIHDLIFVRDRDKTVLLAATNNDLNRGTGATFQPLQIKDRCRGLIAAPSPNPWAGRRLSLLGNGNGPPGTTGSVARSVDGGLSWQTTHMPFPANSTLWNFAVHSADPGLIYASSVSGQLFRSRDQGASWEKCPREFGEIRALAWTP